MIFTCFLKADPFTDLIFGTLFQSTKQVPESMLVLYWFVMEIMGAVMCGWEFCYSSLFIMDFVKKKNGRGILF
ncbi:MAG: hypothetical protein HQ541_19885 [Mariniphaga sp.]|nr:hypothetical protein [Mariniphaga sp.]